MSDTKLMVLVQALITLGLLMFSYVVRKDAAAISDVVVSAAVYHWLRESATIGRNIATVNEVKARNSEQQQTVVTSP